MTDLFPIGPFSKQYPLFHEIDKLNGTWSDFLPARVLMVSMTMFEEQLEKSIHISKRHNYFPSRKYDIYV